MRKPIIEDTAKPVEPILSSSPPPSDGNTTFVAMRHRNYQLYFGGQLISNIGTWMQVIAQGWVVYQLGHSELTLGLVAFASAIPTLIISPWGGVVVDRVSRRNLLMMTSRRGVSAMWAPGFLAETCSDRFAAPGPTWTGRAGGVTTRPTMFPPSS